MSPTGSGRHQRLPLLRGSPLFLDLHQDELELIAELCQELEFSEGETILQHGGPGGTLFIVISGRAMIVREDDRGVESALAVVGEGEFFGEMSVLDRSERSATVKALEPVRCLALTTEDLYSFARIFMNGFTLVVINIARALSRRLRITTDQLMAVEGSQREVNPPPGLRLDSGAGGGLPS